MDNDALQCLPDCSGHGTFDLETQTCTCEAKWSGEDCSKSNYSFTVLFRHGVSEWFLILRRLFQNSAISIAGLMEIALEIRAFVALDGPERIVT